LCPQKGGDAAWASNSIGTAGWGKVIHIWIDPFIYNQSKNYLGSGNEPQKKGEKKK